MASTLTRNQNTYTVNAHLSDEVLFVNPKIASDVEEIEMNIAEDGMDFIFDMLSDLSANRGAYAIREAYSNAYDATVVTGDMTRPIEITLYNKNAENEHSLALGVAEKSGMLGAFSMFASITDHGCGMTCDEVKKYFTQYGGSNKRNGKNTIGSKGLGSKAPLACADLFTVESTKDGITTTATIERKQGRNSATVRSEQTGKDSGTTITIPLTDEKTFEQMEECISNIVKWNLDATLIVNGEKTEPTFTENTLGSYAIDYRGKHINYIFLGNVDVAVDEDGNTVSFRMWQRDDKFPTTDIHAIDLNLAGVRYELRHTWNETADLIVAGEPGFLNFTPSRDEIKDDDAKSNFIEAVENAIANFDFTDSVSRVLSDTTLYEMRDWLFARSYEIDFADLGDGNVKVDMLGQGASYIVPASSFVKDGVNYAPLFGFGDDSALSKAKVMTSSCDWYGKNDFKVLQRDYNNAPIFSSIAKKVAANNSIEVFTTGEVFRSVLASDNKRSYTIFVITGAVDGDQKRFINNEKTIRDAYDITPAIYILCEEGTELSDMDKMALGGNDDVLFVTLDEMMAKAREYRKANRESADKNVDFSKKMEERYGSTIRCYPVRDTASYSLTDSNPRNIFQYEYVLFDYDSVDSFEEFAKKNIIMLIDTDEWDSHSEAGSAIAIMNAMVNNGTLDKSIENILVMPKMNANDIKAFINAGGKFFSDVRKKPSAYVTSTILGDTDGLNAVCSISWKGTRTFNYFEVDPTLVMSKEAASALESADAAYWHAAKDTSKTADVMALIALLDDSYADYKAMMPMLGKVLIENRRFSTKPYIVFKNSVGKESVLTIENYDKLAAVIAEVFSEISLDSFYDVRYNEENASSEIEFRKNAEVMLNGLVTETIAKSLS